jgi:hypothetical protein
MSLELEIKKLTEAVQALSALIGQDSTKKVLETLQESPVNKDLTPKTDKELTHEQLKELCLLKSRSNPDNRAKAKKILGNFNAKKVTDLSDQDLQLAFEQIEALGE